MEQLLPNESTVAAMEEQDLPSFESIDDLMADLNADDQATRTAVDATFEQTNPPTIERG